MPRPPAEPGWLAAAEALGIAVFALSGGLAAARRRLDVVGAVVVGMATALGGGLVRDALLRVEPVALADWWLDVAAALGALLAFVLPVALARVERPVALLDAAGLGLFTVTGTLKALTAGLSPVPAALLGMTSGIGGGVVRDLLVGEVPLVLRPGTLYALASLAGAAVVVAGHALGLGAPETAVPGAVIVLLLRVASVRYGWRTRHARLPDGP